MAKSNERNLLDGTKELQNASDPEAEITEERIYNVEEQPNPVLTTEVSVTHSNVTESLTNFLPSEEQVHVSEVPISDQARDISVSQAVLLDPSFNILGRIVFDEAEDEEEYEGLEQEEEISEPTVLTMDCIDDLNKVEIVEEGFRMQGTVMVQGDYSRDSIELKLRSKNVNEPSPFGSNRAEEKCPERKSPFFHEVEDQSLIHWEATLGSATPKVSTFDPPVDDLVRSLKSSKTYVLKSRFDSIVIPGVGPTVVERYTLCNDRIEVDVINLGARVTAVRIFDQGKWVDVALGLDNAAGYLSPKSDYMGATIGRVADRISEGKFKTPYSKEYFLSKNDGDHHYNGGFRGLHKRMWEAKRCGDDLVLVCKCYENEEGYPGNLTVWTTFSLSGDMSFNIEYYAKADCVTPVNITNAIYFNLAGHDAGPRSVYDHSVFVNAEAYCDPSDISEGSLGLVYKSPYNLTDLRHLGCVMKKEGGDGLDLPYVIYRQAAKQVRITDPVPRPPMKIAAIAHHEDTGRTLVVSTNQWGLRLYTCNKLQNMKGKGDIVYQKHSGFCFQPGNLPNSVNIDHFPEVFISPLEPYKHTVRYSFSLDRGDNKKSKLFLDRTPWLHEEVFLKCDICPRKELDNIELEVEPPYKKTYAALEKLAERTCKLDEDDDDDSLSIHSSFTSFGSDDNVLPMEGDTEVEDFMEAVDPTSDVSECTPKVHVAEPIPLPPYLTGKWPKNPIKPQLPKELPEKRVCPTETSLLKSPKTPTQKQDQSTKNLQLTQEKQRKKVKEIKINMYTPVEMGVIDKIDKEKLKAGIELKSNISDGLVNLEGSDSSFESNETIKNPVLGFSGNWKSDWMETVEKLPWYYRKLHKSCKTPCAKFMGKLFQLINFPQQFYNLKQTHEEIVEVINLQNQFMKSVADSIEYSPGEITLY